MTTEETAAALVLASGALAGLIKPALKAAVPGRRWGSKVIQPLALAASAGCVVGWYACQPGPMDWRTILPQVACAWVLANSRAIAAGASRKEKPPA